MNNHLLVKAQNILHDAKTVLKNDFRATLGPMKIKLSESGVVPYMSTPAEATLQIYLEGELVFEGVYNFSGGSTVSFPDTRYAATNHFHLKAHTVNTYREGLWCRKLSDMARQRLEDTQVDPNFTPIDDTALWG